MRDLRTPFNEAKRKYNNEDLDIIKIKHYPFKKYKVGSPPLTKKRNIQVDQVIAIRDRKVPEGSRIELARDLFMLSFYLCGTNAVDFYQASGENVRNGRFEYNRSKTESRRQDKAFISIQIPEEATSLLVKYLVKLSTRYAAYDYLDYALYKGMKGLRELTGIPELTLYWARHTFGNLARNECRMSVDDVGATLNHIDNGRIADNYSPMFPKPRDESNSFHVTEKVDTNTRFLRQERMTVFSGQKVTNKLQRILNSEKKVVKLTLQSFKEGFYPWRTGSSKRLKILVSLVREIWSWWAFNLT